MAAISDFRGRNLTPEECQQVIDLAGGIRAAARALDMPRTTFKAWMDPEANRQRVADWYAADPERGREKQRRWFANLSGFEYNRRLLKQRRRKALYRRAKRHQRLEESRGRREGEEVGEVP